jgi:hypothetical protein
MKRRNAAPLPPISGHLAQTYSQRDILLCWGPNESVQSLQKAVVNRCFGRPVEAVSTPMAIIFAYVIDHCMFVRYSPLEQLL